MEKHMLAILLNCFFISDATAGSNLRQNAIHMNNPWRFSSNAPAARGRAEAPADFSRSASPLLKFTLRSSKPEIECLSDDRRENLRSSVMLDAKNKKLLLFRGSAKRTIFGLFLYRKNTEVVSIL